MMDCVFMCINIVEYTWPMLAICVHYDFHKLSLASCVVLGRKSFGGSNTFFSTKLTLN